MPIPAGYTSGQIVQAVPTGINSALVLIAKTSFTTTATWTLDNIFSATYDNYRIDMVWTQLTSTANYGVFQMRVGGVAARLLGQLISGPLAGGNLIGSIFRPERKSASGGSSAADFRMFDMANIPGLATGGIVTSPTLALIGEGAGPEAVIPLDRMGEFGMGGGGGVTINVQGGDPQAVVDALTRWYRQNGPLPVKVA